MSSSKANEVELVAALGFGGNVSHSLIAHPNGEDIIYPLGSTVVIKNVRSGKQWFLHGHTDSVTCVALSADGSTIASGQSTHIGFKAPVFLWDFETAKASKNGEGSMRKLTDFHNQRVQSLAFSSSGKYLASLGGTDDNYLVIWNAKTGRQVAYTSAATESALTVRFYNNRDDMLVTAGYHHVRRWNVDLEQEKLDFADVNMGPLRRIVKCLAVSDDDTKVFAGTTTGDVLMIALEPRIPCFKQAGNELFNKGIRSICFVNTRTRCKQQVVIGTGSGEIVALDANSLKRISAATAMGEVSSIAPVRSSYSEPVKSLFVGTNESNIYLIKDIADIAASIKLRASCHYHGINGLAFLDDLESIFVTCSTNDIRVWNVQTQQELLRIQVPNTVCNAVALPRSGELILSGWSDGKIRAFKPVSGQLQFVINDAHPEGVTALAVTNDCSRIISGGSAGAVRFWSMRTRKMEASLKEHKAAVTSIVVRSDDKECVSSSDDGSCITWDLISHRRNQAMFASTMFKNCLYHPDESQILTCGSDRKLTYWCAYEGTAIRILEGSNNQINALAVDREGEHFVCGGNACQLKLFSYDDGDLLAVGDGHSGAINGIAISPDQTKIVSVGAEGGVFVWQAPFAASGDSRRESKK